MRTLIAVLLVGCSVPSLDGSDKTCPCSDGFVCDTMRNRCVESTTDGGIADVGGLDASTDASRDTGGNDAGDAGSDSEIDATRPDAPIDVPVDTPVDTLLPDAGGGCALPDVIYCTDFEEGTPVPYTVATSPEGRFSTGAPAYRGSRAAQFRAADESSTAIISFDPDPLPPVFFVRFWLRVSRDTIRVPNIVANFEITSDERLSLNVGELTAGRVSALFGDQDDSGAFEEFFPDEYVCIRLRASRTEITLTVNDEAPVRALLDLPMGPWRSADFGIFTAPGDAEIAIDDLAIGTIPISCD